MILTYADNVLAMYIQWQAVFVSCGEVWPVSHEGVIYLFHLNR